MSYDWATYTIRKYICLHVFYRRIKSGHEHDRYDNSSKRVYVTPEFPKTLNFHVLSSNLLASIKYIV